MQHLYLRVHVMVLIQLTNLVSTTIVVKHSKKTPCNSLTLLGTGKFLIACTLSSVGCLPCLFMRSPRYVTSSAKNTHFSLFSRTPAASNFFNTSSRFCKCSQRVFPVTSISSNRTITLDMPWSRFSIVLWCQEQMRFQKVDDCTGKAPYVCW